MPAQKITPFLWFNDDAEAAINHYVKVFKNSKVVSTSTRRAHRARKAR